MDRFQAELAIKEQEALEVIKQDVCQWLSKVLALKISPRSFMGALDTGVPLCALVSTIQASKTASEEAGRHLEVSIPMDSLKCNPKAESGSFFARDNTANFIAWCRQLGVEEAVIFESDGLVERRDEKRVILCLLDVARYAEKVGIAPPQLVEMERDILSLVRGVEAEEVSLSPEPPEDVPSRDDEALKRHQNDNDEATEQDQDGDDEGTKHDLDGDNEATKHDLDGDNEATKQDQDGDNEATKQDQDGDNKGTKQDQDGDDEAPQPKRRRFEPADATGDEPVEIVRDPLPGTQQAEGESGAISSSEKHKTVVHLIEEPKVEKKLSVEERVSSLHGSR